LHERRASGKNKIRASFVIASEASKGKFGGESIDYGNAKGGRGKRRREGCDFLDERETGCDRW